MNEGHGRITLCHEHLTIDLSTVKDDQDARLVADEMIEELKGIRQYGVETLIDLTNVGMGRDIDRTKRIARETGLNIIMSTGFYKEPFLPEIAVRKSEQELAEFMVKEIERGIEGTDLKAGVIGEIGSGLEKITPLEEKILRAAALAQTKTGVPLFSHLTLGRLGREQLKIFKEYGVNLNRVVLSHVDLAGDVDYALELANEGVYLGIDTIGKIKYQSDQTRIELIKKLIQAGFADQLLFSLDITRQSQLSVNGGYGYQYLFVKFLPLLKEAGIKQDTIDRILVKNPQRLFS